MEKSKKYEFANPVKSGMVPVNKLSPKLMPLTLVDNKDESIEPVERREEVHSADNVKVLWVTKVVSDHVSQKNTLYV